MIHLILLASGFGKRFGSNKLFYRIDDKAMYLHILEKLHCLSKCQIEGHKLKVLVVSQYQEILDQAEEFHMEAILNEEAEEGIAASVRKGAKASKDASWMAFFTADQPYLKMETIESFLTESIKKAYPLASVYHGDIPGNPTLFHKDYRESLEKLHGDRGGRVILKKNPEKVFHYQISEKEITDIDYSFKN